MTLAELDVPGPNRTALTAPFWNAAAEGRFILQRCEDCGKWVFYPRAICPHCWSTSLDWFETSGRGRLATWTTVHRPGHPGWQPAVPYTIALIELAEGPTMLSHLLISPDAARLGMALRVRFEAIGTNVLPCFEPAP